MEVKINNSSYQGGGYTQPDQSFCGVLPKKLSIEWSGTGVDDETRVDSVVLKDNMPLGFMGNSEAKLKITVDSDNKAHIYFRMKLSQFTTKYLTHPESEKEKAQRLLDESLWKAVANQDLKSVEFSVTKGAKLIQPWMGTIIETPYALTGHALKFRNGAIVDYLLKQGMLIFDNPVDTVLDLAIRENNIELLRALLRNGLNSNHSYLEMTEYRKDTRVGPKKYKDKIIHLAVRKNNIDAVKLLLEYGAIVDFTTHDGITFVEWVNKNATKEIVKLING